MKRREFSIQLVGAGVAVGIAGGMGLGAASPAQAQQAVEGQNYSRLPTPVPPVLPAGKKVEVIEFFSYACPHCFALEPALDGWTKALPADVHFHRVPVSFVGPQFVKMFYALEEIGQREAVHRKIFNAIHVQRLRLTSDDDIKAFLAANGVDAASYAAALKSFGVNTRASRGNGLLQAFRIDGVPKLGVQGRFTVEGTVAGSHEAALQVVGQLVAGARRSA